MSESQSDSSNHETVHDVIDAILHNDSGGLITLCQKGHVNINDAIRDGWSLIHLCCYVDSVDCLEMLVNEEDVDVNKFGPGHITPLMITVYRGNIDCTKVLLNHPKINVNIRNEKLEAAIAIAVNLKNYEMIKLISNHKRTHFPTTRITKMLPTLEAILGVGAMSSRDQMFATMSSQVETHNQNNVYHPQVPAQPNIAKIIKRRKALAKARAATLPTESSPIRNNPIIVSDHSTQKNTEADAIYSALKQDDPSTAIPNCTTPSQPPAQEIPSHIDNIITDDALTEIASTETNATETTTTEESTDTNNNVEPQLITPDAPTDTATPDDTAVPEIIDDDTEQETDIHDQVDETEQGINTSLIPEDADLITVMDLPLSREYEALNKRKPSMSKKFTQSN